MDQFVQKTSVLKKTKLLVSTAAVLFLIVFIGEYLSSFTILSNLNKLNQANSIFELTNISLVSLESAPEALSPYTKVSEISLRGNNFILSQQQALDEINQALLLSTFYPDVNKSLIEAKSSIEQVIESMRPLVENPLLSQPSRSLEKVRSSQLIARQYQLDARDALRKAQIAVKRDSDAIFSSTYQARYRPLIVGVFFSLLFFVLVRFVGLSLTKRLMISVENLLKATDAVAFGNFQYIAPIYHADELGKLTHAFNKMVERIKSNQERISNVQAVAAAFSEALRPSEVAEVMIQRGFTSLAADGGLIALLSSDENALEIIKAKGFSEETLKKWSKISLDLPFPITEVVLQGRPIWIRSSEEFREKYPSAIAVRGNSFSAGAYVPMILSGKPVGVISMVFHTDRDFSEEEKDYVLSLAGICAQALNRSSLFDQAQEAIRLRDEFLSIASHELKTPLTPLQIQIQNFLRLFDKGKFENISPTRVHKMLKVALLQVERLNRLVEELLDVARIKTGKLAIEPSHTDLCTLVKGVVERLSPQLSSANCSIQYFLSPNSHGFWDQFRLEQVVTNLLTNAIRYASGHPIEIHVSSNSTHTVLRVKDHGIGISKKDQARVFEQFERAASSRHFGGLGLGLYITKRIVEQHFGTIEVESEEGKGSVFTVRLPNTDLQRSVA